MCSGQAPQHSHTVRGTKFPRLQFKAVGQEAVTSAIYSVWAVAMQQTGCLLAIYILLWVLGLLILLLLVWILAFWNRVDCPVDCHRVNNNSCCPLFVLISELDHN